MLEIANLSKRFGGLIATNNVSLTVPEGSITALIGPNGAGKTTIFAQISGFHRPDKGEIRFQDQSLIGLTPERICMLGIARTFQIVQPFAGLNVRENIAVGAHLHRAARRAALDHAEAIARQVGLETQLDKPAASLTIAGRKRLELAKALATDPKLILLDEVMAGLNPAEIDGILPVIRRIRESGVTILLIEHVMRAVMNLSDRAFVLNNGALIAEGTPAEVAADAHVIEAYLGHGAAARIAAQQEVRHA
jgi:branched-chain amino acid transport system ATP-binding protein